LAKKTYFIYMLECSNGALYTGYTTDIKRRYREHQQGTSKCKYTRSFPPVKLSVYWQIETDISTVLKIERYIKTLARSKKLILISHPEELLVTCNKLAR
jgi:putative endonuclease